MFIHCYRRLEHDNLRKQLKVVSPYQIIVLWLNPNKLIDLYRMLVWYVVLLIGAMALPSLATVAFFETDRMRSLHFGEIIVKRS